MDYAEVIFWIVVMSCVTTLAVMLRRIRAVGPTWIVLLSTILSVSLAGRLLRHNALIYTAGTMWLVFVVLPGAISRAYFGRILRQDYAAAGRLARIISWLHPADGWRQQPEIVRAFELAQQGNRAEATAILQRFRHLRHSGLIAIGNLYRITNQWEELLASDFPQQASRLPQLIHLVLRACGETGDLKRLLELYEQHKEEIGRLNPAAARDLCRLMVFAFAGRRNLVEMLFQGSLAQLPAATQQFWVATADLADNQQAARGQFEALLASADPPMRAAIERRLASIPCQPPSLDTHESQIIENAAIELGHDESFGATPALFSNLARATQLLIVANIVMFGAEIYFGGSENLDSLYRLGAMFPPAVRAGEWWRLGAALFLHVGPLHLAMNMIGLSVLGPFAEFALGFRRFLSVYLFAGIGSMVLVVAFASGSRANQITVGASGCIMGLVGATGALVLRGWLHQRAASARRRLIAMLTIVAMQTAFDAMIPQVSMTAHLSGAIVGFLATLPLSNRFDAVSENSNEVPAR